MPNDLAIDFRQATAAVEGLREGLDGDTSLKLYALYQQATAGDASGPKPGFFEFADTARYEAWSRLRGMPHGEAQRRYVELVRRLPACASRFA